MRKGATENLAGLLSPPIHDGPTVPRSGSNTDVRIFNQFKQRRRLEDECYPELIHLRNPGLRQAPQVLLRQSHPWLPWVRQAQLHLEQNCHAADQHSDGQSVAVRLKTLPKEELMGYVIKLNHKKGRPPGYVGAVPRAEDQIDDPVLLALQRQGLRIEDFENTLFKTLEEASRFAYPTSEAAAAVILSLPKMTNTECEVVTTDDDRDETMDLWSKN